MPIDIVENKDKEKCQVRPSREGGREGGLDHGVVTLGATASRETVIFAESANKSC